MAIPVLLIGKSGTGKTTSLRNCAGQDFNLINVLKKPLPFKGHIPTAQTDDYATIMKSIYATKAKSIVIDDAGYLITNQFMRNHGSGTGNQVFAMYNEIADNFWNLIQYIINTVQKDKIVYVIMHEEVSDNGDIKPKTIGKLLDEKISIEGMFTIVLRSVYQDNKYQFVTQSIDGSVAKSPIGLFKEKYIDNDLLLVDQAIREYYEIKPIKEEKKKESK